MSDLPPVSRKEGVIVLPAVVEIRGGDDRDPWYALGKLTPARVALGRVGAGVPTSRHLDLQLAQARARDAVWRPFDGNAVEAAFQHDGHTVLRVHSAAHDRREFLARPDLGRKLGDDARSLLATHKAEYDIGFVVGDGLAPLAAERHAAPLVREVIARLDPAFRIAPVVVADQMRVALGDDVSVALGLRLVVALLGERPGMSALDSLGAYVTWAARPGCVDAQRNCVSNVRPEGLGYEEAAVTLAWLVREATRRSITGVSLRVGFATELGAG